jgi:anti-sigma factor RsiW
MIPSWVDEELSAQDAAVLERHLSVCAECAEEAAQQRSFVRGLRERLPHAQAPADVKARILGNLKATKVPAPARTPVWTRRWAGGGALAGAAVAALFLFVSLNLPQGGSDAWTQFFRDDHQAHSQAKLDVQVQSASTQTVAAWLAKTVGHPVHVPVMPDAQLVGGRTTVLRGQTVSLAVYRSDGKALSLFVGDPKVLCPSLDLPQDQLYADAGSPYSVVAWQHHDHFHVLVADLSLDRLKVLAHECQVSAI